MWRVVSFARNCYTAAESSFLLVISSCLCVCASCFQEVYACVNVNLGLNVQCRIAEDIWTDFVQSRKRLESHNKRVATMPAPVPRIRLLSQRDKKFLCVSMTADNNVLACRYQIGVSSSLQGRKCHNQ